MNFTIRTYNIILKGRLLFEKIQRAVRDGIKIADNDIRYYPRFSRVIGASVRAYNIIIFSLQFPENSYRRHISVQYQYCISKHHLYVYFESY